MRRLSLGIPIILLYTILLGADTPPFTPFENGRYGYRLDIPAGFTMKGEWGMQTSWVYVPGEKEKFDSAVVPIISVVTYEIPKRFSASTLFDTKLKKVQEMIAEKDSSYEDLETLTVEGGYALMYKEADTGDDQALNHWYVKVYGHGREYTVEISGTRGQLRERRSDFKHVVDSFELIP
jgi:hypothetical protein